jgi:hypothetical protein
VDYQALASLPADTFATLACWPGLLLVFAEDDFSETAATGSYAFLFALSLLGLVLMQVGRAIRPPVGGRRHPGACRVLVAFLGMALVVGFYWTKSSLHWLRRRWPPNFSTAIRDG